MTNDNVVHISSSELYGYVDDTLSAHERMAVTEHLRECRRCNELYESVERFHVSLRSLPVDHARADFTKSVMERLHRSSRTPFAFRILENVAYLFGLFIVLGIMLTVFVLTGTIDVSGIEKDGSVVNGIWTRIAGAATAGMNDLANVLNTYLPFAFGKGSLRIVVFAMAAIALLAVADRFVARRLLHNHDVTG